jgi:hypothetical protein
MYHIIFNTSNPVAEKSPFWLEEKIPEASV